MLKKAFLAGLSLVLLLTLRSAGTADASANYITVQMACAAGGGVDVQVAWTGGSNAAVQQWLDVSLVNNGWRQGTFGGVGPVGTGVSSIVASGLMPSAVYFVRVNQMLPGGWWDASPTFAFRTGPDCAKILAKPTLIVTTKSSDDGNSNDSSSTATPPTIGTSDNCHANYYGACLKPTSIDYDCQGKGDGPDYIRGPVYITGSDPFELDNDGDGIGCNEP